MKINWHTQLTKAALDMSYLLFMEGSQYKPKSMQGPEANEF